MCTLATRLGFAHEGTLRGRAHLLGEQRDEEMFGMVRSGFAASPAAEVEIEAFDAMDRPMSALALG